MLTCETLRKSFYDPGRGEVRAVDGINLHLDAGVVALVGANGAGKSTLLRLIATLLMPDSGSVVLDGIDTRSNPAGVRQRLGYLSTTTRLYPRLTGREMLAYAGGFYGLRDAALAERIEHVSTSFGIADFIDQRCDALSTGQGQRVNLARTMLADPPVLILDEPTTGLDLVAAKMVVDAVQAARRADRLIIIATHVMAEVEAMADRLILIDKGQIDFDGAPSELGAGLALAAAIHQRIGGTGTLGTTAEAAS
ncbi:MAG: ABC transporter ATP-binding protein [Planctomycetota bacterium]|nr:ABC transporter ATP-binding protein [Planctomycetota bacterium]